MHKSDRPDDHQTFIEWSALAQGGMLGACEREKLESHLQECDSCREIYSEYSLISSQGMPLLGAHYCQAQEGESWDDRFARRHLFTRVRKTEKPGPELLTAGRRVPGSNSPFWNAAKYPAAVGLAACLIVGVAVGGYHFGSRVGSRGHEPARPDSSVAAAASTRVQELTAQKKAAQDLLDAQAAQISQLQTQVSSEQLELARFRVASRAADESFSALSAAHNKNQEQLRQVSEQRDKLASQLRDVEQAYQSVRLELTSLRAEHDRVLLRTTSLESKIDDLTASTREQDRKLRDDEQYLASDRDIRELMGARKLYIADVFDVDSRSRTRKPFGRVFYTQNKSLIFYAFDLDHEPGVKNASAFQVWGQKDNEQAEKAHPMNLGILYMDSELNRRWVLRFDDPKELAEIDAVFVTVEPNGGSQKPTGKPLLYALLRKEANHP
jgi:hypothetical protein